MMYALKRLMNLQYMEYNGVNMTQYTVNCYGILRNQNGHEIMLDYLTDNVNLSDLSGVTGVSGGSTYHITAL